jgi:hypothetical protein
MAAMMAETMVAIGGGIAAADGAGALPLLRYRPSQQGCDKLLVEARTTGAGAGTVIRPVYLLDNDPLHEIQDPANDRAVSSPGDFLFEFDAMPGARMGIRVVSVVAGGTIFLRAAYGRSWSG